MEIKNQKLKKVFAILSFLIVVLVFASKAVAAGGSISVGLQVTGTPPKTIYTEDKSLNQGDNNKIFLAII